MTSRLVREYAFWKFLIVDAILAVVIAVYMSEAGAERFHIAAVTLLLVCFSFILELRLALHVHEQRTMLTLSSSEIRNALTDLEKDYVTIKSAQNRFFLEEAKRSIESARDRITSLASGHLRLNANDLYETAVECARLANSNIDAITAINPIPFWNSTGGKRYAEANYDACKRGVRVRRIFVLADGAEANVAEELLHEQTESGVQVRILTQRTSPIEDYAILDNDYIMYVDRTGGTEPTAVRCVRTPEECEEKKREYRKLWDESRGLEAP